MVEEKADYFAARLRELREEAGLTQTELAAAAGMHLHAVIKLEKGTREPLLSTAVALANALKVSLAALLRPPKDPDRSRKPGRPRKKPAGDRDSAG